MGRIADTLVHEMLDEKVPTGTLVGLSGTKPTDTGGNITAPTGGGYAEVAATMGVAAGRSKSNSAVTAFPQPTADWLAVDLTYFTLHSKPTRLAWAASTVYALNDVRIPTVANGREYKATTAGTSGATEPIWPTTAGATVTDGTVVWTENGLARRFVGWGALATPRRVTAVSTPPSFAVGELIVSAPGG